jgi:uncharacterized glyoxalase superfamily protein PhnB
MIGCDPNLAAASRAAEIQSLPSIYAKTRATPRRALGQAARRARTRATSAQLAQTQAHDIGGWRGSADKIFNGLAEGGQVEMPLGKTFFAPRFGMLSDKFGVGWMVIVPQ